MLNGTLCATERALCCILENYQTEKGLNVPEVLRPYVGVDFIPYKEELLPKKESKGDDKKKKKGKDKDEGKKEKEKGKKNEKNEKGKKEKENQKEKEKEKKENKKEEKVVKDDKAKFNYIIPICIVIAAIAIYFFFLRGKKNN